MDMKQEIYNAETGVVGSILIDPDCLGDVMLRVTPEHFVHAEYRRIFDAITELWQQQKPVDAVTVLDKVGQEYQQFIIRIMELTPTAANVLHYTELLKEQSQLYRIQTLASNMMGAVDLSDARAMAEQIYTLLSDRQDLRITSWAEGLRDFWERQAQPSPSFVPWGFSPLDKRLQAEGGDYVLIGGFPSSGKTAFALQIAKAIAARGYRVGFFSLETKDRKLIDRVVAQQSGISLHKIKRHGLDRTDWDRITARVAKSARDPLYIISANGMSVSDIQAVTMAQRYDVIFIDYVQLIRGQGYNRTEVVTNISMELHNLCQRTGVMTVGLCQLSRPEKGANPKRNARMSDLRESGQLEQDADIIMMLNVVDEQNRLLQVLKNKDGDGGEIDLAFEGEHVRFDVRVDPEDEEEETNSRGFAKPTPPPAKEVAV